MGTQRNTNIANALDAYQASLAMEGDKRAFALLYKRWHPRLLRLAFRLTGHREDAQDVMQEASLTIASKLHRLNDPELFGAWALTIVRRRAVDQVRKHVRTRRTLDAVANEPPAEAANLADEQISMHQALAELAPIDRTILELFYLDGLTGPEMSAALGIPLGTVKSRLSRARTRFKSIHTATLKGDHDE